MLLSLLIACTFQPVLPQFLAELLCAVVLQQVKSLEFPAESAGGCGGGGRHILGDS